MRFYPVVGGIAGTIGWCGGVEVGDTIILTRQTAV